MIWSNLVLGAPYIFVTVYIMYIIESTIALVGRATTYLIRYLKKKQRYGDLLKKLAPTWICSPLDRARALDLSHTHGTVDLETVV